MIRQTHRFAALCLALLVLFFLLAFKVSNNDIWGNLAQGQYLFNHHALSASETFAYSSTREEVIIHTWLSDYILFSVFHFFSFPGLIFLKFGLFSFGFFALFFHLSRDRSSFFPALAGLILTFLVVNERFVVKAEMFGFFYCSIFLIFFNQYRRTGRSAWLVGLGLVQMLWANQHGSFLLGPLLAAVFFIGDTLDRFLQSNRQPDLTRYLPLAVVLFGACLANPYGYRLLFYPVQQTTKWIYIKNISEWLPPLQTRMSVIDRLPLWFAGLNLLLILVNRKKVEFSRLALFLVFFFIYLYSRRFVLYFGLIGFYVMAKNLNDLEWPSPGPIRRRAGLGLFFALEISLAVCLWRQPLWHREPGLGAALQLYPSRTIDCLKTCWRPDSGRLLNNYDIGNFLIWSLYPEIKVFIDGRNMVYDESFYRDYLSLLTTPETAFPRLAPTFDFSAALLSYNSKETRQLIPYLLKQANWRLAAYDNASVLFLRSDAISLALPDTGRNPPDDNLAYAELFRLLGWEQDFIRLCRLNISRAPQQSAAYDLLIEYYNEQNKLSSLEKVLREKERQNIGNYWDYYLLGYFAEGGGRVASAEGFYLSCLRLNQDYVPAYNNLGSIYLTAKKYALARHYLTRGRRLNPDDPDLLFNTGLYYRYVEDDYDKAKRLWSRCLKNLNYPASQPQANREQLARKIKEETEKINSETILF